MNKCALAYSQMFLMILGIVSFAYMIGMAERASGNNQEIREYYKTISDDTIVVDTFVGSALFKSIVYYKQGDKWYRQVGESRNIEEDVDISDEEDVVSILNRKLNPASCLTPSTLITLANLQTKPISEIRPGDEVLSYDFEKRALTKEVVRNVIVLKKYSYLKINDKLEITPNHEVLLNGKWQPVGNAKVSDYFLGIDGKKVFIEKIEIVEKPEGIEVFDLDLGGKWYFAEGVLVHNSKSTSLAQTPTKGGTALRVDRSNSDNGKGGSEESRERDSPTQDPPEGKKTGYWSGKRDDYPFEWAKKANLSIFKYGGIGHLVEGLTWAIAVGGFIKAAGSFVAKENQEMVDSIAEAAFLGVISFKTAQQVLGEGGWFDLTSSQNKFVKFLGSKTFHVAIGAAVAWWYYVKNYEKTKTFEEQVEFKCLPWQAPHGGEDCDLCNQDGLPCSEYRCKSLGQTCALVNQGTGNELCVDNSKREVSPPIIMPWNEKLTEGYAYTDVRTSPPGPGFRIVRQDVNPCIKAFSPIQFGVLTNEPAQCKIDLEKKNTFEEMLSYMDEDSTYRKNFSAILHVPRAKDLQNSSLTLEMGKEMTLYIMCRDAQGNVNQAPYAVRFCVDDAPDNTPPQIKAVSIESENCIAADQNSSIVEFYTDEPAECRWDFKDKDFEEMTYNMSCVQNVFEINSMLLYTCRANLIGIKKEGTDYYIRCKDNPGLEEKERNKMMQSFKYSVRGSNPLKIKSISPNNTKVVGGFSPFSVELKVETLFGCNDNKATCFYSLTGYPNSFIPFFDTNKADGISTQRLDLYDGRHKYYVKCIDAGGNLAETEGEFELEIVTTPPLIARAFYSDDYLRIETNRISDCVYSTESCDYLFNEGTNMPFAKSRVHVSPWDNDKTYYIKCKDEFGNEPTDCSLVVTARKSFFPL
ncbi:MAG: Hint domain-containing protein [Candidatus Pacearchaeota archaeon]